MFATRMAERSRKASSFYRRVPDIGATNSRMRVLEIRSGASPPFARRQARTDLAQHRLATRSLGRFGLGARCPGLCEAGSRTQAYRDVFTAGPGHRAPRPNRTTEPSSPSRKSLWDPAGWLKPPFRGRGRSHNKKRGCLLAAPFRNSGGSCWIRTSDQLVKSQLLYQLS